LFYLCLLAIFSLASSIQTPESYIKQLSKLLELKKALYGLKDALLLWYKHLKETLTQLGLRSVKNVSCLFINERLIVFFYMDDIVVLVYPNHLNDYRQFKKRLEAVYSLRKLPRKLSSKKLDSRDNLADLGLVH
jgi:hypothetical protein